MTGYNLKLYRPDKSFFRPEASGPYNQPRAFEAPLPLPFPRAGEGRGEGQSPTALFRSAQ